MSHTFCRRPVGRSATLLVCSGLMLLASAMLPEASALADVHVDVGFRSRSRSRGYHRHHCRPYYRYRPYYVRPVIVPRPVVVEREVIVERQPVRYWQAPVVQQVQPAPQVVPQPAPVVQQLQPAPQVVPQPAVQAVPLQPATAQVPISQVPLKYKGRLPAGPTKSFTCTQPYTNISFCVPVPANIEPRKVDYDKREIELKYEDGEIEIEFHKDGSVTIEYDF